MIPITYAVMWIGSLALGRGMFRSFAGFYSKDIISNPPSRRHTGHGNCIAFWLGIAAAVHDGVLFLAAYHS